MLRRSMSSLVPALTVLAGSAAAQPIPNRTTPIDLQAVAGRLARTEFNVWATGSSRTSRNATKVQQCFIAHNRNITEIQVNVQGGSSLQARILGPGGEQIGVAPVTVSGDVGTATFSPAVSITPGEIYTVRITGSGDAKFFLAKDEEAYVFSNAAANKPGANSLENTGSDLNLRIKGQAVPREASPIPSKRALLILIENGGVTLNGVKELRDAAPTITYWTCGSCKFEARKNESLDQMLLRMGQSLGNCLQCVDPSKWKQETVTLESWFKEFSDFALEEVAKAVNLATTGTANCKYDKVVKCEDSEFNAANVLAELDKLDNYLVDIHVLSHGGENSIVGYNNARLNPSNFFTPIEQRRARGETVNIRAVYQMNCFSGSLVQEWLAVGADVVNGTGDGKLNMMPPQYFGFLKHWLNGEAFDTSVQKGFDEVKWFFDVLYANQPSNVTDSRMFIHGNDGLRFK